MFWVTGEKACIFDDTVCHNEKAQGNEGQSIFMCALRDKRWQSKHIENCDNELPILFHRKKIILHIGEFSVFAVIFAK